jgi:hypothetical protein
MIYSSYYMIYEDFIFSLLKTEVLYRDQLEDWFILGGGVDYDIEHCQFLSYFLPNLQLNIGKKYLKTAKIIDESLCI